MKIIKVILLLALLPITAQLAIFFTKVDAQDADEFFVERFHSDKPPVVLIERILADDIENLGKIIGSYRNDTKLYQGDQVYIKATSATVSVGDKFTIYVNDGGISVPGSFFKRTGNNIHFKGSLQITKVLPKTVVATILETYEDVFIGDQLTVFQDLTMQLSPKEPKQMVNGTVLTAASSIKVIGPFEFVYLDKGSQDGLSINDRLFVYRTGDGKQKINPDLPQVNIAELVVAHVSAHHATAYCVGGRDSFNAGAPFKSAISEVKYLD